MIQFTKSYKTTDGQVHATIDLAKAHEITLILQKVSLPDGLPSKGVISLADVTALILAAQNELVDILTTTPNSKPKARTLNGGTKKRKSVSASVPIVSTPTPTPTVITAAASSVGSTNNA